MKLTHGYKPNFSGQTKKLRFRWQMEQIQTQASQKPKHREKPMLKKSLQNETLD